MPRMRVSPERHPERQTVRQRMVLKRLRLTVVVGMVIVAGEPESRMKCHCHWSSIGTKFVDLPTSTWWKGSWSLSEPKRNILLPVLRHTHGNVRSGDVHI